MKTFGKILMSMGAALFTMLVTATAFAQEAAGGATAFNDRDKFLGLAAGLGDRHRGVRWRARSGPRGGGGARRHRAQPGRVGQDLHADDPRPRAHRVARHLLARHRDHAVPEDPLDRQAARASTTPAGQPAGVFFRALLARGGVEHVVEQHRRRASAGRRHQDAPVERQVGDERRRRRTGSASKISRARGSSASASAATSVNLPRTNSSSSSLASVRSTSARVPAQVARPITSISRLPSLAPASRQRVVELRRASRARS